jgi:hypothetical protein
MPSTDATDDPVKVPKHYNIDISPCGSVKERLELRSLRCLSAHLINEIMPLPLLCFDKVLHLKKLVIGFLAFGGDAQVHAGAPDRTKLGVHCETTPPSKGGRPVAGIGS